MKLTNSFFLHLLTLLTLGLGIFSSLLVAQNNDNPIDPSYWYRLTNMWQGDDLALDIVNDGKCNCQLQLAKTANVSGQYWKLTPVQDGWYKLTTAFQKEDKCLDIVNDGQNNRPQLAKSGNYSGQYWRIVPTNDGFFQLYTMWQTENKVLDVMNDGKNTVLLGEKKGYSGQFWKLTKIRPIQSEMADNRRKSSNSSTAADANKQTNGRINAPSRNNTRGNSDVRTTNAAQKASQQKQPNLLNAESFRGGNVEIAAAIAPKNTLLTGTQLKLSAPPSDWEAFDQPIRLRLLESIVINGEELLHRGTYVQANVSSTNNNQNPSEVSVKLLAIETSEGLVNIKTNDIKVSKFNNKSFDLLYLGSDGNFEVPIETGIYIQENVPLNLK
ncbi:MAG: RICIN domain-containing protein [Chitinophagales bacterium]